MTENDLNELHTCPTCRISHPKKDFYGKELCYKCIYNQKVKVKKKENMCVVCGKNKPQGRSKYCSKECSLQVDIVRQKSMWYRKLTIVNAIYIRGWH
jgi:hypothetical protein